ncbi:MAG: IS66 family insertion sequence element accessory protein TnpB [Rhodobacteraceae bacterium]|nr:IS66 family insertion sequence element accessory protein TnpB [Paracoccaceae bacterium]
MSARTVGATDRQPSQNDIRMLNVDSWPDRLKLLYWDGTGLVMAYKRLEDASFTWPAVKDGVMALNHAQFEALFAGLDWRRVKALETRPPAAAE